MVLKRNKRGGRPSPYPRFLFHGLRSAQLLGSIVVSGIMCYFMYYLREYPFSCIQDRDGKERRSEANETIRQIRRAMRYRGHSSLYVDIYEKRKGKGEQ